jgi:hypothetical protein
MITIDLLNTNKYRKKEILSSTVGRDKKMSPWLSWQSRGLSGFWFEDRVHGQIIRYDVILEKFPDGIGVYCRSIHYNFLVLIPYKEIRKIDVRKESDVLRNMPHSWFKPLLKLGFSYEKARHFILENERISFSPLEISIETTDNRKFLLKNEMPKLKRAQNFFSGLNQKNIVRLDIKTFEFSSSYT